MPILHIDVTGKRATYNRRDGFIVCGNGDYTIQFTFDDEWRNHADKIARFIWAGGRADVPFSGNTCQVPVICAARSVLVGVCTPGSFPISTTPVQIGCMPSILDQGGIEV